MSNPSGQDCDSSSLVQEVVQKLRNAAEIEQQFMCMYLYGAFSIQKRYVNEQHVSPNAAQLEMTRSWANMIYSVARQEMEHLALVNNLLRSIGGAPYFARSNLVEKPFHKYHLGANPVRAGQTAVCASSTAPGKSSAINCDELVPIPHDFVFSKFDLDAARRWTCMEAPECSTLVAEDGSHFAEWCFRRKGAQKAMAAAPPPVEPGTIEELYRELKGLFARLPVSAFVNGASTQVVIEQQYDIYVFPVTDHATANQAMSLITEQGEGINASPTYESHYHRFYDIVREWEKAGPVPAAWDLKHDPVRNDIEDEYTGRVFELFNGAYETLLIMLTGLYATTNQLPTSYPYLAPALGMEAFAPFMTMVIRSLAEVLVQLRATDGRGGKPERVGPGFIVSDALNSELRSPYVDGQNGMAGQTLKPIFADIDYVITRVEVFSQRLLGLINSGTRPPVVDPALADWVMQRMQYIQVNSHRIAINLRRIYQQNVFSALQSDGY
jgi:hypothetical protein